MLKFIKILNNSKGVTFNGEAPFIHWFEGPRSVNLWHFHRLLILGPKQIDMEFAESSIFTFYTSNDSVIDFDGFQWEDINKCIAKHITSIGDKKNGEFIHQIIILAKGEGEGEYIDSMTVSYNGHKQTYRIGIELFNENEQLKINLANMGVEIPEAIVKALYPSDLFEDYTDWVLINRKWRELLSNYMDIWGCKGNYKSLINSLKWFEYGDLVELREVWKHETNGGLKLSDKPISQWLTSQLAKEISYNTKTTYFILRHLSIDINKEPTGLISGSPYDDNEVFNVPVYADREYGISCKWGKDELRMKLALLGSFFETYFMPIHLDLMRSVVEDVYFNILAILIHGSCVTIHNQCSSDVNDCLVKFGDEYWDSSAVMYYNKFNLNIIGDPETAEIPMKIGLPEAPNNGSVKIITKESQIDVNIADTEWRLINYKTSDSEQPIWEATVILPLNFNEDCIIILNFEGSPGDHNFYKTYTKIINFK